MARLLSDRLTAERLQTQTIGIKLRLRDWRLLTRDQTVPHPTTDAEHIATVAAGLMRRHWHRQPLRLLGLRLSSLTTVPPYRQATLFPDADRGSASS